MAVKPNDIVCRRVPISFIHTDLTAKDVLPRVVEIMGDELGWNEDRRSKELREAVEGLASMK